MEFTAAREAAGESLWTNKFDQPTLVRLAEICVTMVRVDRRVDAYDVAERLGRILRLSAGWDVPGTINLEKLPLLIGRNDLILDVLAAMPEVLKAAQASPETLDVYPRAVNQVLNQHRIAHKFVDGELIPFESDELLNSVVEPALRLMTDARFKNAHDAYLQALMEIGNGEPGDAITDAGTALQEAFWALGLQGNSLGNLLKDAKRKGMLAPHDQTLADGIAKFIDWASADRSETGDAHKITDAGLADAWLMVHVVGALIVRLTDDSLRGVKAVE